MRFARAVAICLLALLLVPVGAQAAQATATLDRDHVQLGDTVTLNVRVEGASGNIGMPDLSAVRQDFDVLSTSQNSSLSLVNGNATSSLTFGVALRPKHSGTLQIPSLSVAGEQTAPLQLEVSASGAATATAQNRDVFMEARVEPERGYVGEQFSYVVKLFYATSFSRGSIDVPTAASVQLNQLGKDLSYETQRSGRNYQVLERRYSLVPQQAGRIEIPAASFQGNAIDPYDPNSFFGATNNVAVSAPDVAIEVRAAPSSWGKNAWLPARALSLSLEGWPSSQQPVRVGQPINLTMTLQATGLSDEVLPALSLPPLEGATAYPDKPVSHNHVAEQWIVGQRQQAFAIVPERAGTLTIPATTLKWWNVLTDKLEEAQIPAHRITVLPAIGSSAPPVVPAAATSTSPDTALSHASASRSSSTPWRWIALGSIVLWLCSMLAWWLWRRRVRSTVQVAATPAAPTTRRAQLAFLAAARGSDVAAQTHTLLAWARAERPGIQHLGEVSAALDDVSQRAAIDALQQRHYAGMKEPSVDTGVGLAEAFKRGFSWRSTSTGDGDSGLPALYPFTLH